MPRTVPTIDGSGQLKKISVKYVDANNGRRSDSWHVDNAATDAQIEAAIAAAAAATQSCIYAVEVAQVYSSNPLASNAIDDSRESVRDNVVVLYKNPTTQDGRDFFIPAPKDSMFLPSTNIIDNTDLLFIAFRDAIDAMLNNYAAITVRFTERRKKNPATSAS